MNEAVFTLQPAPPYDFDRTAAYATYYRGTYGAESYTDGVFRRLLDAGDSLCLASVRSVGTVDRPLLQVDITAATLDDTALAGARRQISWILGVEQDLLPFHAMAGEDPTLAPLVTRLHGLHMPQTASVYEALILAIVGQQISSQVAATLRTLLINAYGPSMEVAGQFYRSFPRAKAISAVGIDGLRAVKLSNRKAEYIRDISTAITTGELELEDMHSCDDEEVVRRLVSIRGVGPWTAHWLLIRALGRSDGFPHGDLALCRTLGQLMHSAGPMKPQEALEHSRRWSPYRSYVTTYLFAAIRSRLISTAAKSRP